MMHRVTSKDGVLFWVESQPRTVAYDHAFAASKTAAELAQHGDFAMVKSLDELLPSAGLLDLVFPAAPRIRPQLKLIQGGKS